MSQQIHAKRIMIGRAQDQLAWQHALELLRAGAILAVIVAAGVARAWG